MKASLSASAVLVVALSPTLSVIAGVVPISGEQSSTGKVSVVTPPDDPITGSYSLAALDPLASWSPPDQHLSRVINTDRYAEARIDSLFASTILFDRVSLTTSTSSAALTGSPFNSGATVEYTQTFHLTFTLDAPTAVTLAAQIGRNNGGWATPKPFSLRFGRDGDAPIIAFAYGGSSESYSEFIPPTALVLEAGTYTVLADNYNFWGAGYGGQFSDFMMFDLQVVPGPASVVLFGLGMLGVTSRRRRAS